MFLGPWLYEICRTVFLSTDWVICQKASWFQLVCVPSSRSTVLPVPIWYSLPPGNVSPDPELSSKPLLRAPWLSSVSPRCPTISHFLSTGKRPWIRAPVAASVRLRLSLHRDVCVQGLLPRTRVTGRVLPGRGRSVRSSHPQDRFWSVSPSQPRTQRVLRGRCFRQFPSPEKPRSQH